MGHDNACVNILYFEEGEYKVGMVNAYVEIRGISILPKNDRMNTIGLH
jgi:hypothetical protein